MITAPDALSVPLRGWCQALQSGELQLSAYLTRLEERLAEREPEVQSLIPEAARFDRLRSEAAALGKAYASSPLPPLFGVAIGVKDIFHVDGFPTRAGSRLPAEALAGAEAESVRRLRKAGALILGKTVSTEFAYFAPGPTHNPRRLEHTPGGSSSGSAAAVAAGFTPLALGTQTIGSVLRPASFCGVVGFKPSYGRVSTRGVIPLAPSLDHVGWFTIQVDDAALAASILCADWTPAPSSPRPVLGLPEGPYLERADRVARAAIEGAVEGLQRAGFVVQTVPLFSDFEDVVRTHQTILAAEAARVHAAWFRDFESLYHPRTADLIRRGQAVDDTALAEALRARQQLRLHLQKVMASNSVDLWIAPAAVGPAPAGLESTGDPVMNLPWTQVGFPAISLPCGTDPSGLPLGLQLVAAPGQDEALLAWAAEIEGHLSPGARVTGVTSETAMGRAE